MSDMIDIYHWLEAHVGRLPEVAQRSGVPYWTILNVLQGKTKTPRAATLDKLRAAMNRDKLNNRYQERA